MDFLEEGDVIISEYIDDKGRECVEVYNETDKQTYFIINGELQYTRWEK